ncbi:NAD-binding protein [Hydrogenimonas sp.]
MKIIVAGAGRVGFNLARTLSIGHDVTVIDKNAEALHRLQEALDILPVHGDIEDPLTYRKLIDKEADLFIAVTDLDEANIVSTLIAGDVIDVKRKFIRLRNTFFAKSSIKQKLGIDEAIFPMQLTSDTVETLLAYPRANNVKTFRYTAMKLISLRATGLAEPKRLEERGFFVVGIEREKRLLLRTEEEPIRPGDLVYLFGEEEAIRGLCEELETSVPSHIERAVVFGAGDLGVAIARRLLDNGIEVKLLDKDIQKCETADEALEGEATAISCKYGTATLFEEEGLERADLMIAATDDDEYNIVKCMEAREHAIAKVVAVNNELEYYGLMHALGIVVVRGPKIGAYHAIVENINSSGVVMERKYCGGKGSVFLRKIFPGSRLVGRRLKPPPSRLEARVVLVRDERLLPFERATEAQEGDVIAAFVEEADAPAVKAWVYGL